MHRPPCRARRLVSFAALGLLALSPAAAPAEAPAPVRIDTAGLPPRSLPEAVPARPVPAWLRSHLRIGHLPGGLGRMPEAYARAGYNVITINALRNWELVGPSATLYDSKEVARADRYLRDLVALVHGAGAKAVLYIGPVQVPL